VTGSHLLEKFRKLALGRPLSGFLGETGQNGGTTGEIGDYLRDYCIINERLSGRSLERLLERLLGIIGETIERLARDHWRDWDYRHIGDYWREYWGDYSGDTQRNQ
jgi:hypothetical protein